MVQTSELLQQMQNFHRRAYENVLAGINSFEDQTEKMTNLFIDQAVGVPEQSKSAARMMVSLYRIGFDHYKKLFEYACRNGRSF